MVPRVRKTTDVIGSNVPWLDCPASNANGINLYGCIMILLGNLYAYRHSDRGTLSHSTPVLLFEVSCVLVIDNKSNDTLINGRCCAEHFGDDEADYVDEAY